MKKNLVILGNQFLCEKRMLNIVQRTIIMDEDAIDVYIHNHQLFKDQRAIVVDPEIPVHSGHIFTGDAFIDPVNFTRTPIEGEIEEEEMESTNVKVNTPEIVKWLENIMDEIRSIKGNDGNVPRTFENDTKMELINKMNSIYNAGYNIGRLSKPIMYRIKEGTGNVDVYAEPSTESDLIGYFTGGDLIIATAYNNEKNFVLLNNGGYIKFNVRQLYIIGTVHKTITNTDSGVMVAYVDEYDDFSSNIPGVTKNIHIVPHNIPEIRCYEKTENESEVHDEEVQELPDKEYTKEEKLREMVEKGYSVKDIAHCFDVNTSTVYKWLKKYNIKKSAK